jgi:hypothetical protein
MTSRELILERPETLKSCQSTPVPTQLNLQDLSIPEGETANILSRLNETLAQIQQYVSTKPFESQLPTPKPSLDSTNPLQGHWNPHMIPGFDTNPSGTWSSSFDLLTPMLDSDTDHTTGNRGTFILDPADNAVSAGLRATTASSWLAASKPRKTFSPGFASVVVAIVSIFPTPSFLAL